MSLLFGFDSQHLPAYGKNWRKFLLLGVALVILGALAISASMFTTFLSIVLLGVIMLGCGVLIAFDTFSFWRKKGSGFLLHLLMAAFYIILGIMFIENPVMGSITLTLLLGIFYVMIGIFRLAFAPTLRTPQWGWAWLNGIITLLLGIMIITSWPASGLFVIGLFIGIDLLFCGWAYIMTAMAGRKLSS